MRFALTAISAAILTIFSGRSMAQEAGVRFPMRFEADKSLVPLGFSSFNSGDRILSLSYSPDGAFIACAAGSRDPSIRIWDIKTQRQTQELIGHDSRIRSIAIEPHGKYLASASGDSTIRVWDIVTGRELHRLAGHRFDVVCLTYSKDGKTLFSGGADGTLRLWDVDNGSEIDSLIQGVGEITSITLSPNGNP